MCSNWRRFLATLAPMILPAGLIAAPATPSFGQVAPPATAKGAAAPKSDPALRKVATPLQGQGQAAAEAPPRAAADPDAARKMEDLLKRWEAKSKTIETLSVKYTRFDKDPVFDVTKRFEGDAKLRKPDFVYLDFFEVVKDKPRTFDERIVCDGKKVYQFRGGTKQVFIYPLPKNQEDKALNQGALPFLFGMSAAKAKSRYEMTFRGETATAYFIQIVPLLPIDREEYVQAYVKLGKDTLLPEAIQLLSPNLKETKTFTFAPGALVSGSTIPDSWFDGVGMTATLAKSGWKVIENPGADGLPRPAPAVGARPAPGNGGRPATKGQAAGVRQR